MEEKVRRYNDAEKLKIIEEYMSSGESLETFQSKYGMGHCTISRWIRKFGLSNTSQKQYIEMRKTLKQTSEKSIQELSLEAKVAQLEKELKEERMKSLAYSTMIDVAEEEFGIEIRKKAGAKQ